MATSNAEDIAAEIAAAIKEQARPEIRDGVDSTARAGRDFGRSIAPVANDRDTGQRPPGTFRDSIELVERDDTDEGLPAARLESNDPAAEFIEYGTKKTPEHAVFARIAKQFAGDLMTARAQ